MICFLSSKQTLILCHATHAGLDVLEQEFWLCCHRVSNVLSHGKFLTGQGMTELWIAEHLEAKSGQFMVFIIMSGKVGQVLCKDNCNGK